jgi:uncharacterized protein YbaP (TraB family)
MTLKFVLTAALVFLLTPVARAQEAAGDPEAVLAEELVVQARVPGPAWWKATDADSTVWILGAPSSLPKGLAWDARPLDLRLEEARTLLKPVTGKISTIRALTFFLGNQNAMRGEGPLEERLPPELRTRFIAARTAVGKPASRYERWRPGMAAMLLSTDFYEGLDMQADEPLDTVKRSARRARVRVKAGAAYDMNPVLREFVAMDDAAQLVCLEDAVRLVESGHASVRGSAQGWAQGDLGRALAAERGFDRCLGAMPTMASATRRALSDTTAMVHEALRQPGVSVIVVGLRSLLARDGVVTRLRAAGVEVRTPEE